VREFVPAVNWETAGAPEMMIADRYLVLNEVGVHDHARVMLLRQVRRTGRAPAWPGVNAGRRGCKLRQFTGPR